MAPPAIVKVVGRFIIDSRGNPTVEADVSEFVWREVEGAEKRKKKRAVHG